MPSLRAFFAHRPRRLSRSAVALLCLSAMFGSAATALRAADEKPAQGEEKKEEARFDYVVRNNFFMGIGGDQAALDRGMRICEEVLAKNPKHAEALVWHGTGLMFLAGRDFGAGENEQGMKKWTQALKEMDEAVQLEPKNVGVRVPRGAVLIQVSRFVPNDTIKKQLLEKSRSDFEAVYEQQKEMLIRLGTHPRGELLFGLAESARRLGDEKKARGYLEQIVQLNKGSEYESEAKEWLEKDGVAGGKTSHNCIGCHVEGM
jgi:tetratricopeptide (TPR) repeat protein